MIKKIIAGLLVIGIVVLACFKIFSNNDTSRKDLKKIGEELTSYHMEANMDITNANDDIRKFYVNVDYMKGEVDHFRISLIDKEINQEQIMIRNSEGVYVLTPKLNQVYEFKGDYPLNTPKPYLYHSIIQEIEKDNYEAKKTTDGYIINAKMEYKNHPSWNKQEIKLSKDLKPVWVNIYDSNNNLVVAINFIKVEFNIGMDKTLFDVEANIKKSKEEVVSTSKQVEELPLIPKVDENKTSLKEQTEVVIDGNKMYILSYTGDINFTLVQKDIKANDVLDSKVVSGELVSMYTGVGFYENKTLTFIIDEREFQIYSPSLTVSEMLEIVSSMQVEVVK